MQLIISSVCMALTSAVIGNAYYQKKQFYPAVVYITKSNASMAVIYIQFFVIVFMFGKLLRKIFLGTLRAAEFEHLLERFWYALTETCLAFTVFRDDFNPRFVALFTVLLFLKSFHWLAEERVDFMERSPVLGWLFHIRVASLLSMLGVLDYILLMHAYNSTLVRGPTVQLVFGFEYAILLTVIASTAIKYVLHAAEMRTDTPWENKAVFLLYTELVIGLIKVVLYLLFVVIMAKIYALPMFVFRPMFFTIRNFRKALNDVIMSRRAIRNMNTLYPDATPEELRLSDNICIICREDMVNHSKKLPCGHIFHTTCLRSWFQRQQTCPTCRLNILRTPNANSTALPPRQGEREAQAAVPVGAAVVPGAAPVAQAGTNAAPADAQPASAGDGAIRVDGVPAANPLPTGFEIFGNAAHFANALPNFGAAAANGTSFPSLPMMPPLMMAPPFTFLAPYNVQPPPLPPDLTNFSVEELQALEGNERKNIEERIKYLRNIELMLDAASILMNNYQIATRFPIPAGNRAPVAETTATAATSTSANKDVAYDRPSTSAAAAVAHAILQKKVSHQVKDTTDGNSPAADTSTQPSSSLNNKVTIEDLGADDDDIGSMPTTSSLAAAVSAFDDHENADNAELSELRKRRLKFLEERNNKSTTATTPTE